MAVIKSRKIILSAPLLIGFTCLLICAGGGYWLFAVWIAPSILGKAISEGDVKSVEWLLKMNPSLTHHEFNFQDTPLALAAEYGHADIARLLIDKGADMYHDRGSVNNSQKT